MQLNSLLFLYFFFCLETLSSQKTIYVPADLPTIQEALDSADLYDTVLVAQGTYFENLVWPAAKDLHLISEEGPETTIIDGSDTGRVVEMGLLTEASLFEGFTLQNGFSIDHGAGIKSFLCTLNLRHLIITNNRIVVGEDGFETGAGAYLDSYGGDIVSCQFISNLDSSHKCNFSRNR